jgi:V/A-type H+-transporting ATPase subunit I
VAVIIGTFHLASAYAIAVINQVRSRNYIDALLSHLPTLLLYSSAVPFALSLSGVQFQWQEIFASNSSISAFEQLLGWHVPVSLVAMVSFPILAGSFLTLILGRPLAYLGRPKNQIVKALGEGLLEASLKPIEFLANTVSYARLGIFLIIGTIMGSLANRVLELGILGIPLAAVFHIGQMAIEGLIVYIQDLRLHLYEWLSKFYFGLGIPFTALALRGEAFEIRWT